MLSPVSTLSASFGRLGLVVTVGVAFGVGMGVEMGLEMGVAKGLEVGIAMGVDGGAATVVEGVTGGMAFEGEARLAGDDSLRPRFCEGETIVKS